MGPLVLIERLSYSRRSKKVLLGNDDFEMILPGEAILFLEVDNILLGNDDFEMILSREAVLFLEVDNDWLLLWETKLSFNKRIMINPQRLSP